MKDRGRRESADPAPRKHGMLDLSPGWVRAGKGFGAAETEKANARPQDVRRERSMMPLLRWAFERDHDVAAEDGVEVDGSSATSPTRLSSLERQELAPLRGDAHWTGTARGAGAAPPGRSARVEDLAGIFAALAPASTPVHVAGEDLPVEFCPPARDAAPQPQPVSSFPSSSPPPDRPGRAASRARRTRAARARK